MITELYEIDQELTEYSLGNVVSFEILEKSGNSWQTVLTLSPSQIMSESLDISQAICDNDEIVIGGCVPSQLRLNVMNVSQNLTGKRIAVKVSSRFGSSYNPSANINLVPKTNLYPSDTLYPSFGEDQTGQHVLFCGPIISYKRSENKAYYKIVAFDRMYYPSTIKCKESTYNYINSYWDSGSSQVIDMDDLRLNNLLKHLRQKGKITLPDSLRSSFINYNEVFAMNPAHFKEVIDNNFTALQGLRWICELNGAFWLEDMPSNLEGDNATPRNILPFMNQNQRYTISSYSQLTYEDYVVKGIRKAEFFASEGKLSTVIERTPSSGYSTYTSDNGFTKSVNNAQAANFSSIYTVINNLKAHGGEPDRILGSVYEYRPFKASIFNRWWVQVGDRVRFRTNDSEVPYVDSIVLSRRIKGINGLTVTIEAKGLEVQGKENDASSE